MPHLRKSSRWRKPLFRESIRPRPLMLLTFLPLLTLIGCGESKISQCNKLITEINRGQGAYEKSTSEMRNLGNFNPSNPEELKAQITKIKDSLATFVQEVRTVSQDVKALTLADSQLQELRTGYTTQLEAIATGLDDSGKAMSSLGDINFTATDAFQKVEASTKQIGESIQAVSKAGEESNRIVGEINTYCEAEN
jgi:TolA-binding protein